MFPWEISMTNTPGWQNITWKRRDKVNISISKIKYIKKKKLLRFGEKNTFPKLYLYRSRESIKLTLKIIFDL